MKKKYILCLLFLAIVASSCQKALDLKPTDSILEEVAITTVSDLEQATLGAYAALAQENILYVNTLMSDESRLSNENTGQGQFAYKWQHSSDIGGDDLTAHWTTSYRVIDRANKALTAASNMMGTNPADESRKNRFKGELLALRAIAHFDLFRLYSKGYEPSDLSVPVVISPIPADKSAYPSRSTVAQVIAQVKADLTEAKSLIPASQTDIYRLSRTTVTATQVRVALYTKNWDEAITLSTEVINLVPLASRNVYPQIFTDQSNAEVVFKLRRNVSTVRPGDLWQRSSNGDVFYAVSNKLLQAVNPTADVRYGVLVKINNTKPEKELVNKYPGSTGQVGIQDIKFYRTSEMYLIRAEAYAEKGDAASLALAASDLNTLRNQRITGNTPMLFTSKAQAIDAIYAERFVELAYEGHRYFDLRRRNMTITRLSSDLNNAPEAKELKPDNYRYILPIPQVEIFANKNIEQNPQY